MELIQYKRLPETANDCRAGQTVELKRYPVDTSRNIARRNVIARQGEKFKWHSSSSELSRRNANPTGKLHLRTVNNRNRNDTSVTKRADYSWSKSDSLSDRHREYQYHGDNDLHVICHVSERFQDMLGYGTSHLAFNSSHYDNGSRETSLIDPSAYKFKWRTNTRFVWPEFNFEFSVNIKRGMWRKSCTPKGQPCGYYFL